MIFGFDTAVSLTSIELDLFLCPEWNIGASLIVVYGDENRDLVLGTIQTLTFLGSSNNQRSQSSCDSLSTLSIPLQDDAVRSSYLTLHIVLEITEDNIEWVHVGEVRFLGTLMSSYPDHDHTQNSICTSVIPTTIILLGMCHMEEKEERGRFCIAYSLALSNSIFIHYSWRGCTKIVW